VTATANAARMMTPLQIRLDHIRRRWWLVLAVMAIAALATTLYSLSQQSVHTGMKALRVSSMTRGPEEDAVLAQGYVEYFNQPSAQQALRVKLGLPSDVAFNARNSASSPIFYVEAIAPDTDAATASANKLADTFRDDINTQVRQGDAGAIAGLRALISAGQEQFKRVPSPSTESSLMLEEIRSWQKSINDREVNTTNQLMDVLPTASSSSTSPNVAQNAALALAGGLILGVLAALALASAEERLVTPQEVQERPELDTRLESDTLPGKDESRE
jgi:succinoglycan biosynthesis transport protein ExoP